ncbi:hypothetical protein R1flu_018821 [Riccia fluitans]|uniref:G-protein coupled receptors family 3 profile domain-containing protein n=1 Tax=Riccia fluitans TaxID=41844 RepID=A0ABD1ZGY1_9MARC
MENNFDWNIPCPPREDTKSPTNPPGQPWDYVIVGLISVGLIPFIAANLVMIINRNYLPIKTKSVDLTVISSLGGIIWLGATVVVNNHFGREKGTLWTVCSLWTFWLQACFGFALWLNCLILRLINLYFILILRRGSVKWVSLALLALLSPIITLCIFASAFGASRFKKNEDQEGSKVLGDCKFNRGWSIGLLLTFPLYFCIFVGLGILLRNVRPLYNEFRLIMNGGVLSAFLYLLTLVTVSTKVHQEVTGRCFLLLAVAGLVFYYFYARNAEAVYNCVFNRQEYLEIFRAQLNAVPSSSHSRTFDNPAEEMLYDAREESLNLQSEINELEQELAKLEDSLKKEKEGGRRQTSRGSSGVPSRQGSFD